MHPSRPTCLAPVVHSTLPSYATLAVANRYLVAPTPHEPGEAADGRPDGQAGAPLDLPEGREEPSGDGERPGSRRGDAAHRGPPAARAGLRRLLDLHHGGQRTAGARSLVP